MTVSRYLNLESVNNGIKFTGHLRRTLISTNLFDDFGKDNVTNYFIDQIINSNHFNLIEKGETYFKKPFVDFTDEEFLVLFSIRHNKSVDIAINSTENQNILKRYNDECKDKVWNE